MRILTNNPLVRERCGGVCPLEYVQTGYEGVLRAARDAVHRGEVLLVHPLYGSVKPRETPYRSLLLSGTEGPVDPASLEKIETALAFCRTFPERTRVFAETARADFARVDLALFESGLEAAAEAGQAPAAAGRHCT